MDKPIILYNTTIDALLKNKEQYFQKMKNVFEIFEKRNDAVLLWRPHPLLLNVIETMLPNLVEEYENLVKWYQEKQVGIYDDSTDLNRALMMADAYYGDESSIVELFSVMNKPILIQNAKIMGSVFGYVPRIALRTMLCLNEQKHFGGTIVGKVAFIVDRQKKMSDVKILENNCKGGSLTDAMFFTTIAQKNDIFICIKNQKYILKYDWEEEQIEQIDVESDYDHQYSFFKSDNDVYLVGLETMNVYIYDKKKECFRLIKTENHVVDLCPVKRVNSVNRIALYDKKNCRVCIYDIKDNQWEIHNNLSSRIIITLATEEDVWVVTEENYIYVKKNTEKIWNRLDIKVFCDVYNIFDSGKFVKVYYKIGNIYVEIDKKTKKATEKKIPILGDCLQHKFIEIGENCVVIFHSKNEYRKWLDKEEKYTLFDVLKDEVYMQYDLLQNLDLQQKFSKNEINLRMKESDNKIIYETDEKMLVSFIQWLYAQDTGKTELSVQNSGKIIHHAIMKSM